MLGTISVTPWLLLRVVPDSGHGAADFPCRYSLERRKRGLQRRAGLVCHCSEVVSGAGPAGGQSGCGGSWLPGRGVQARHRSPSHRSLETAQVCVWLKILLCFCSFLCWISCIWIINCVLVLLSAGINFHLQLIKLSCSWSNSQWGIPDWFLASFISFTVIAAADQHDITDCHSSVSADQLSLTEVWPIRTAVWTLLPETGWWTWSNPWPRQLPVLVILFLSAEIEHKRKKGFVLCLHTAYALVSVIECQTHNIGGKLFKCHSVNLILFSSSSADGNLFSN